MFEMAGEFKFLSKLYAQNIYSVHSCNIFLKEEYGSLFEWRLKLQLCTQR